MQSPNDQYTPYQNQMIPGAIWKQCLNNNGMIIWSNASNWLFKTMQSQHRHDNDHISTLDPLMIRKHSEGAHCLRRTGLDSAKWFVNKAPKSLLSENLTNQRRVAENRPIRSLGLRPAARLDQWEGGLRLVQFNHVYNQYISRGLSGLSVGRRIS